MAVVRGVASQQCVKLALDAVPAQGITVPMAPGKGLLLERVYYDDPSLIPSEVSDMMERAEDASKALLLQQIYPSVAAGWLEVSMSIFCGGLGMRAWRDGMHIYGGLWEGCWPRNRPYQTLEYVARI